MDIDSDDDDSEFNPYDKIKKKVVNDFINSKAARREKKQFNRLKTQFRELQKKHTQKLDASKEADLEENPKDKLDFYEVDLSDIDEENENKNKLKSKTKKSTQH